MFRRLLPKEIGFFDFFEQHSKLSLEVCRELHAIALNPAELVQHVNRIKDIEHQADDVTHKCIDAIHRTFITPIDRADIHRLIRRLDDILDAVDSTASRMMLYEMNEPRPELRLLAEVLLKATTGIDGAIHGLRHLKRDKDRIQECCTAVYEAEKEGDQILKSALARLFKEEKETIRVIKWKEVFERLEKATDRCEEAANIVEGIVIEAS